MTGPVRPPGPWDGLRVLAGLAVQPFLAGGLAFVLFPLLLLDRDGRTLAGGYPGDVSDAARSVAIGAALVAAVVAIAGVLPVAAWLMQRRQPSFKQTLLFGLGFGNLPYLLLGAAAGGSYGAIALVRGVMFSSLLGVAGAALFWLIAIRPVRMRHPDTAG